MTFGRCPRYSTSGTFPMTVGRNRLSRDFLKVTGKGPEVEYIRQYLRHHPKVTEQGPEVEYLWLFPKVIGNHEQII